VSPSGSPIWSNHHIVSIHNQHAQSPATLLLYNHMSCHINICIAKSATQLVDTSTSILPSHPPTLSSILPSDLATSTFIQPLVIHTATCQPIIGPCHVQTTTFHVCRVPHVIFVLVQLSSKMKNLSDMCHLLVLPCVPTDVTCRTTEISNTTC
jgi:hypothetical protein